MERNTTVCNKCKKKYITGRAEVEVIFGPMFAEDICDACYASAGRKRSDREIVRQLMDASAEDDDPCNVWPQ